MATEQQPPIGADAGLVSRERPLSSRSVAQVVAMTRVALAAESARRPGGVAAAPAALPVIPDDDLDEFVRAVRVHRVSGLLVDQAAAIGLPEPVMQRLHPLGMREAALGLLLARETARAYAALTSANIDALVMKGVPLSLQTTGSLNGRGAGDIDLLIEPGLVARAHAALNGAGWTAGKDAVPEPGPVWSWTSRVRREHPFDSDLLDLDLHWRVGLHQRPLPTARDLIARASTVAIDGVDVRTLTPTDALGAACIHVHLDRYARLRSLVDIVRLVRRPDVVVPPGASRQYRRLVADVVAFAGSLLGGIPSVRLRDVSGRTTAPVRRQERLWQQASVLPIWSADVLAVRQLAQVYSERARYSGAGPAALLVASDFVLPPERLHPGMGVGGVVHAIGAEARDFVDRRILGR